jgi:hypothetical protein
MFGRYTEIERLDWLQAKARGRNRFIWRRGVLPTLLIWLIVLPAVSVFGDHRSSFSLRPTVLIMLVMLPICLLGGYLEGVWKWKDLEEKYPD